jgi:predicted dehydrogenase
MRQPFRIAIIGMGGYARLHHETIHRFEREKKARLICTCDPQPESFRAQMKAWDFQQRGVRVFEDYRAMLHACADEIDLVVISTPIPLHQEMHQACVEAGVACYLEKPPTLDYAELEEMIETDGAARKKTFVGFNFISESTRLALKERLLAGDFGALQRGSLTALWRRPLEYFNRNSWSGRLRREGRLVLDSCFGNAMGHFVHNMLFWVGQSELYSWGMAEEVRAELYRANAIEGADTFFVEALASGVPLRFVLSHACDVKDQQVETIICEKATIRYIVGQNIRIDWRDGRREVITPPPFLVPDENYLDYFRYLRGQCSRPATTLQDCRPFVYLNDLTYISSGTIDPVLPERLTLQPHDEGTTPCISITNLEADLQKFVKNGIWPGVNGWGRLEESSVVTPRDLPRLSEVVDSLLKAVPTELVGKAIEV